MISLCIRYLCKKINTNCYLNYFFNNNDNNDDNNNNNDNNLLSKICKKNINFCG